MGLDASTGTGAELLVPPDAEKVNYVVPSFFEKFFELQAVMWRTNAGLTERHAYDSRPQSWPVLRRGIVSVIVMVWGLGCAWREAKIRG
jgi:dolichyl-phosphate-mannose--protein O-mannosyl transferase